MAVEKILMKLLIKTTNYNETIKIATNLDGNYNKPVIFHCYWNGILNEKHLYSVLSCYYFNVLNNRHKIILWLENNTPNAINIEISKYCEIKEFCYNQEIESLDYDRDIKFIQNEKKDPKPCEDRMGSGLISLRDWRHAKPDLWARITEYADFIRMILLYNYGGCWFDLDCFFLRSFDPIFKNYENDICAYQWEKANYPNNAILISLEPESIQLKYIIDYFHNQNSGWRTQGNITYSSPLPILVLPCSWFDAGWIKTNDTKKVSFNDFFKNSNKKYNFDNFYKGAFCYHWHNRWNMKIEENSIINQLALIIKKRITNDKS